MIIDFQVTSSIPIPARTLVNVVQTAVGVNRKIAQQLIHDGAVRLRGRVLTQSHIRLDAGDELQIDYAPQPVRTPKKKSGAKQKRFEVVFDDDHLIVVNKPAGLLTVPSPQRERNTLRTQVRKWVQRQHPKNEAICVHRLDRGVSGLLVFAKNEEIAQALRQQFANRKPQRRYAAIVQGMIAKAQGRIESYLTTDPSSLNRYSVDDSEQGELAITHYRVKQNWGATTQIELRLETGRRNQIRVHMAEMGHPILGESRYRPEQAEHVDWPHKRLALHAEQLGFRHPDSGEELVFESSWPQEFRDFRRRQQG